MIFQRSRCDVTHFGMKIKACFVYFPRVPKRSIFIFMYFFSIYIYYTDSDGYTRALKWNVRSDTTKKKHIIIDGFDIMRV